MKLTIVGLRDEYVQRLAEDMRRHKVTVRVIPRVLEPGEKERRHTVELIDSQLSVNVYDETPTCERAGIILGKTFTLTLWNDAFYSMYIR
jgi:predicted metal-dependent RNase